MQKVIIIFILGLLCSSTLWARGAYKWTDDAGTVHYSDRALGKPSSVIRIPVSPIPDTPPAAPMKTQAGLPPVGHGQTDPNQSQQERELYRQNCITAQNQLATNQRLQRMYRVVDGERHYLTEAERADIIQRSEDAVSYWCKEQP